MPDILALATAGLKTDQLADTEHARYPRVDYLELQRLLDIKVFDYSLYNRTHLGGFLRYSETQLRSDIYLALLGLLTMHRYRVIFTMSERVGTPFAGLRRLMPHRKPFVSMFTCWSPRQEAVITKLNLLSSMDAIAVHCGSMKCHLVRLGASASRLHVIPYGVDHHFFSPLTDVDPQAGSIISVGETRSRDYPTLFQAVDGLPVKVLVAPGGRWYARAKNNHVRANVPENVTVSFGFSLSEMRRLYAQSQFVVLPVYDSVYSAGATAILEAMCMGRAVIVTRSAGILDYVVDCETGILVNPGDVGMMREAITFLLGNPKEARRMGQNARQRVVEELNLDIHVERVARLLKTYL